MNLNEKVTFEKVKQYHAEDGETFYSNRINGVYREGLQLTEEDYNLLRNFEVRENDIFVITFQRSGTNVTQHIMLSLADPEFNVMKTYSDVFVVSPFLEKKLGDYFGCRTADEISRLKQRILKTHLDFAIAPIALTKGNVKPKIVYVTRNPKDTLVSNYYVYKHVRELEVFLNGATTFDEFFDKFVRGETENGDWFGHNKRWLDYCFSAEGRAHTLVKFYEDIAEDKVKFIKDIAEFTGLPRNDEDIERAFKISSFKNMKPLWEGIRKGIVGDWKNHFSKKQSNLFDERLKHELREYETLYRFE